MKALIFDFDGTILDTEVPDFTSWKEMYEEHGAVLPLEIWGPLVGTSGDSFNPYLYLEQCIGKNVEHENIRVRRRKRYDEMVEQQTVLPGIEELLKEAKEAGLKIGLASSSSREWVVGHLTRLKLLDYFDCIRTSDDVAKVKPDPELYLSALKALGVSAGEAIAIEDSPNGAQAAKRAGIYCIVIPNEVTKYLTFNLVDDQYDTLHQVRLSSLLLKAGDMQ
jgi:HAD superfamily hydrolase (TIGR01509 family)